jgi:predicted RNase H-like HicB family nuclease
MTVDTQPQYDVVFEPQDEGGFTAYVPDLPAMIKEAMALYLESRQEHRWELPKIEHRKLAPAA